MLKYKKCLILLVYFFPNLFSEAINWQQCGNETKESDLPMGLSNKAII